MPEFANPYTAGDPVGKTNFFVGREDVLKIVDQVLRHPTHNAITLFGQRRIGKTSILQYLEAHLGESGPYYPVYFDLMDKTGLPLHEILRDLARAIRVKLKHPEVAPDNITEKSFKDDFLPTALKFLPGEASLVLLLDEFDVLADPQAEQHAKRQFFSYLRELRQLAPQKLQFVFVLGRNIDDLDVVARGLFKDLPSLRVSLLDKKNAEALIKHSERQGGMTWTAEAVEKVWELTSGHPYLTQALCSQIWENAHDTRGRIAQVQPSDVEKAVAGTLERSQNMFAWLWEGLGPAEKVVAAALAGIGPNIVDQERLGVVLSESGVRILISELEDAPQTLQKWDILAPVNGGFRFRVELLRLWISENKPLSRTQDELDNINPVANNLFEAAQGLYQNKNLVQSEARLREALGLNPNHLRAHELLAEILLSKNSLDEAQQILENLSAIAPDKARRRLKQVYLKRAEISKIDTEKRKWYEKILEILPNDLQALEARRLLLINATLDDIARLVREKSYAEAYQTVLYLVKTFADGKSSQLDIEAKYNKALSALRSGKHSEGKRLLAEVIATDPDYKQASRHLYLAVTGESVQKTQDPQSQPKIDTWRTVNHQGAEKKTDSEQSAKSHSAAVPTQNKVSSQNPLAALNLLWRFISDPERLKLQLYSDGQIVFQQPGNNLIYALLFWPILVPVVGIFLGLWGNEPHLRDLAGFSFICGLVLWLVAWLQGNLSAKASGWMLVVAIVSAILVLASWVVIVLAGITVSEEFVIVGILVITIATFLAFGVEIGVTSIMGAALASGIVVGLTLNTLTNVSLGFLVGIFAVLSCLGLAEGVGNGIFGGLTLKETNSSRFNLFGMSGALIVVSLASGITMGLIENILMKLIDSNVPVNIIFSFLGFAAFAVITILSSGLLGIVILVVAVIAAFFVQGIAAVIAMIVLGILAGIIAEVTASGVKGEFESMKPGYWLAGLLFISWLALIFLSFGGLTLLQTGIWPDLYLPF